VALHTPLAAAPSRDKPSINSLGRSPIVLSCFKEVGMKQASAFTKPLKNAGKRRQGFPFE